jgi:hypothetical protein
MNGPQHYLAAEQLLAMADESKETTFEGHNPEADRMIARAHVHALLAKVALDALCQPVEPQEGPGQPSQEYYDEWVEAIEIGERNYEGVAFGGTTDPSVVSQQNAENAR